MKTKSLKKKRSDEDRGENKKMKSNERRLRSRRDSSCSSDSDDVSRSRKKSSRRKKKSEKKKTTSRKARYRSLSSSSSDYSSRSCSTCSYSDRSRNPSRDRKVKLTKRSRNKGKEKERGRGRSQKRARRSPSRSTCEKSDGGSSRGRSRSRTRSTEKHKVESEQLRWQKSSIANEAKDEDKIIQAYDDFPSSRMEEGYADRRMPNTEHGELEKKTSEENEDGGSAKNIDGGGIGIDLASGKSETVANTDSSEAQDLELILRQKALENLRKFRGKPSAIERPSSGQKDESVRTELAKLADGVVEAKEAELLQCKSTTTFQRQESNQGGSHLTGPRIRSVISIPVENENENSIIVSPFKASKSARSINNSSDVAKFPNQVKKLERPNVETSSGQTRDFLDKSAAEHGSKTVCEADVKIVSPFKASKSTRSINNLSDVAKSSNQVKQLERPNDETSSGQTRDFLDKSAAEHGSKTVCEANVKIVSPFKASKSTRSINNSSDVAKSSNQVKKLERPNDETSSGQTRDFLDKSAAEHGSKTVCEGDVKISAEGLASGFSASSNAKDHAPVIEESTSSQVEQVNKNGNVPVAEDPTGSQFEKKTFSRMHEGEMVQVSYKVYIPKKSPALARRQLQR